MLDDQLPKKYGCASQLMLVCQKCDWSHILFSSKWINGSFEVNRQLVYGMRSIGVRHSGARKCCAVVNIPTLPTKNNYIKLNKSLRSVVYDVANDSMKQAGEEMHWRRVDKGTYWGEWHWLWSFCGWHLAKKRLCISEWLCFSYFHRHWEGFEWRISMKDLLQLREIWIVTRFLRR